MNLGNSPASFGKNHVNPFIDGICIVCSVQR